MDKRLLLRLLKAKAELLINEDNILTKAIQSTEIAVYNAIIKILKKLDTTGGNISNTKKNRSILLTLKSTINKVLKKSTYSGKIEKYLTNFDTIERVNRGVYKTILGQSIARLSLANEKKLAIETIVDSLTGGTNSTLTNPLRRALLDAVTFGRTFKETRQNLRDFITGSGGNLGALSSQVSRVTRDALNGFDGLVNDKIREEFSLDAFFYVNSLVATSRDNCEDMVRGSGRFKKFHLGNGLYKVEDLPSILKVADKGKNSGYNPAVTAESFARFRFGYNCRHQVIYTRIEDAEAIGAIKINEK